MPSSKRQSIIHTSRVIKKPKERKKHARTLLSSIQACAHEYNNIFVFSVYNMRNQRIKQVRNDFSDSRIVMGKTKVMMVALGKTPETEVVPGVSGLGGHVSGEVGLLFTNRSAKQVEEYFDDHGHREYARAGTTAEEEVRIPPGEIMTQAGEGEDEPLPVQIEPQLRKLGVPTRIKAGKVVLEEAPEGAMLTDDEEGYVVCRAGDVLDSRQTSLLKILRVQAAEFKVNLNAVFDKSEGVVKTLKGAEAMEI
jgi:mRNA turnover protein 4